MLDNARFYVDLWDEEVPGNFAESYQGGSWHSEVIDGASFWYPKRSRRQVGVMQISGGPYPDAIKVQGYPEPFTGLFVDAVWAKNANVVLGVLEAGLKIGDKLELLHPLAAFEIRVTPFADGARHFVSLACRTPDMYHLHGIVHNREGLIFLEIRRPDLIRLNEFDEGGYDECEGGMFDEGWEQARHAPNKG